MGKLDLALVQTLTETLCLLEAGDERMLEALASLVTLGQMSANEKLDHVRRLLEMWTEHRAQKALEESLPADERQLSRVVFKLRALHKFANQDFDNGEREALESLGRELFAEGGLSSNLAIASRYAEYLAERNIKIAIIDPVA